MKSMFSLLAGVAFVLGTVSFSGAELTLPMSAGVNLGTYSPSLSFWNNQLEAEDSEKFGRGFIWGGDIRIGLTDIIFIKLDGGYWTGSVVGDRDKLDEGVFGREKIRIRLIPLSLSWMYYIPLGLPFSPYLGGGGGIYFIGQEWTRASKKWSGDATQFGSHILLGMDVAITDKLSLSGEYRYIFGDYAQPVRDETGQERDESVSFSGPRLDFRLNYALERLFGGTQAVPALRMGLPSVKRRPREVVVRRMGAPSGVELGLPVSLGVSLGGYTSSLDLWNNQLSTEGSKKEFEGASIYGASIKVGIADNIFVKLDGNYWEEKVVEDQAKLDEGVFGRHEIGIRLIPFTLSGVYYFPLRRLRISPYSGIGGGLCLVKVKQTQREKEVPDLDGLGFGTHILLGADVAITDRISLSGEYRYLFGEYPQEVFRGLEEHTESVSLSGPRFDISLNFTLGRIGGRLPASTVPEEVHVLVPREYEVKLPLVEDTGKPVEELRRRREETEKELERLRKLLEEER